MKKQITTLFSNGVWELVPREWSEVKAIARAAGEEVVMGRCHHIVSIKHSERPEEFWEYKVRGSSAGITSATRPEPKSFMKTTAPAQQG